MSPCPTRFCSSASRMHSDKTKTRNDVLFIIGNWNAKVGSQEVPGVAGKFDHGVKNEVGQRLTEFCLAP